MALFLLRKNHDCYRKTNVLIATIDRFPVRASVQNKSIFPATFHTFPGIRTWEPTAIPLPRVMAMGHEQL